MGGLDGSSPLGLTRLQCKVLARLCPHLEAPVMMGLLPSSRDCWWHSVPCSLPDSGPSFLIGWVLVKIK